MFTLNNGTVIDDIGYGTYKVSEELTGGRAKETVAEALDVGYRYIDTAAFYGNEKEIGQAIRQSGIARGDLFIATKVWKTELGYEKTQKSIEASLERLGMDCVDLFLIHWPKETPDDPFWKEKIRGSWAAMEEAQAQGKIKSLGLSNFLPHHIEALAETARVKPVLDQLELHAGHMQHWTVAYLKEHDILPQAWSPLGRTRVFRHPVLTETAARYGVTVSDLLLRFLLQQGIQVLPKATSREHMRSNLHPAEFTLSREDLHFMNSLPSIGWSGEHPDFKRAPIDTEYAL